MKKIRSHAESSSEMMMDKMKHFISNLLPSPDDEHASQAPSFAVQKNRPNNIDPHTQATMMAFVDAVIPSTWGALDLRMDDFMIWMLDHYLSIYGEDSIKTIPLSSAVSQMLDVGALQLMAENRLKHPPDPTTYPNGGAFAALSPEDRFQALSLLENLKVDLENLPAPFRYNGGFIENIINALHQMIMGGYYSEWFAFGATRKAAPEDRKLERNTITWDLVHYPGVSVGYRELRGFLLEPQIPFAVEER